MKSPRELANACAVSLGFLADAAVARTIEAAINEAIEQDVKLLDQRLFLPVDFVRTQNAVFEERIAGLQAHAKDCEKKIEELSRKLVDAEFAARGALAKVKADQRPAEQ